jgi:DNA-binding transcriptional LysR family regulator
MVRAGLGLGIIPDGCVQGFELSTRTIRDLTVSRTIRLMFRPNPQAQAVKRLIDCLRTLHRPV